MKLCPWPDCGHPLEGLERFCHWCDRYASDYRPAGEPPAPRRDDPRSEKEIQSAVKNTLRAMGFSIWDTSQPFAAKITPGLADLFVTGRGVTAWLEVKSAVGVQSEPQEEFQAAVEASGGLYFLVRHEGDVAAWVERVAPTGRGR